MDSQNTIKLHEILHDYQKQKIYLKLEYAEYGDIVNYDEDRDIFSINNYMKKEMNKKRDLKYNIKESKEEKKYYDKKDIIAFIKHILLGLDFLHKNGIILSLFKTK